MSQRAQRILYGAAVGFVLGGSLTLLLSAISGGFRGDEEAIISLFITFLIGLIGAIIGALIQDHRFPPD